MSDYGDTITSLVGGQQQQAAAGVTTSAADNPDDAQRAFDLAQASGVPAETIYGNLDAFERYHKAAMASQIVQGNPQLQQYANSHPLAPKISNDDWGQLDKISRGMKKFGTESLLYRGLQGYLNYSKDVVTGFGEGFSGERLGSWIPEPEYQAMQQTPQGRINYALVSALGFPIEGTFRGITGLIHGGATAYAHAYDQVTGSDKGSQEAEKIEQLVSDPGLAATLGGIPGLQLAGPAFSAISARMARTAGRIRPYVNARVEPPRGIDLVTDHAKAAQAEFDAEALKEALAEAQKSTTRERNPDMFADFIRSHTNAEIGIDGQAVRELYADSHPMPDDGILGWIPGIEDQLVGADHTGGDIKVPLADWLAKVDPKVARELHDHVRVRGDGLTLDEAKGLEPIDLGEDGVLAEQGEDEILYHGTSKDVPFKKFKDSRRGTWFTTDPAEASQYAVENESMGVRLEGNKYVKYNTAARVIPTRHAFENTYTVNELPKELQAENYAKAQREFFDNLRSQGYDSFRIQQENGHSTVVSLDNSKLRPYFTDLQAIRDSAGLRNLEERAEPSRVTLAKTFEGTDDLAGTHEFDFLDEKGKKVGDIQVTDEGKNLKIDYVRKTTGVMAGPETLRDIARQLKAAFPEAETISGDRITGAREKAGTEGIITRPLAEAHEVLSEITDQHANGWIDQGSGIEIQPLDELKQHEQAIFDKINDIFDKMAPQLLRKEAVRGIRTVGKTGKQSGIYAQFQDQLPLVIWALEGREGRDAATTARHEIIHHLRQYGFFTPSEWQTLKNAALSEKWLEKFNIRKRYPGQGAGVMIEEAIAEGFAAWLNKNPEIVEGRARMAEPSGLEKVWMKIQRLYVAIKSALKEQFGREPSFDDLFHRVETGEIGQREGKPINPAAYLYEPKAEQDKANAVRVKRAAIRINNKVYEGISHFDALEEARKELGDSVDERIKTVPKEDLEGFTTSDGRFVNREEAATIADKSNQASIEPGKFNTYLGRKAEQGELDVTRLEDKDLFAKANAVGMTVKQYKRYLELMEKRDAEDNEFAAKQNQKMIERRQTQEWKDHEKSLRQEIKPNIQSRPDLAADDFLREGTLYGEKIKGRPRLDSNKLTPEQKNALPADYHTPGGIHPDDAAGLFGYQSGSEMVGRLAQLQADRGNLGPREYINKLVESEVERRMQIEHGDLAQNIIDEAQDHVISQTQFDMLHEETLALATQAGMEMSLTKQDMQQMAKDGFARMRMSQVGVEQHLRDALKASEKAEKALLDEDPKEAFRLKQQQLFSFLYAREAKALAKQQKKFERNMKLMQRREVPSVDQPYTNFVHQVMLKIGYGVKRSVQDLNETISKSGYRDLEHFWDDKTNPASPDPREMPIAEFLFDPNYRKDVDAMTVDEFRAVHDSIQSMIHNGRNEKKILRAGEKADLAETKGELIDQLKTFAEKRITQEGTSGKGIWRGAKGMMARLLQLESIFNRIDRGDPKGLFNTLFSYPASEAGNTFATLTRKYSQQYRGLGKFDINLNEKIPNNVFIEPLSIDSPSGEHFMPMTRKNLRAVMQNVGNQSNLDKLARGYNILDADEKPDTQRIMNWLHKHAKKEDWDWAQAQGKIWEGIFDDAATMIQSQSGLPPEKIPLTPIQTRFGTYDGWYHKIVYDPNRPGTSKALMGKDPLEQLNYNRATTPRSWEKQRTGYAAPIDLSLDHVPRVMGQVLRDIAFRPFISETAKIFYDHEFQRAFTRHFGDIYKDMLIPYLQDIGSTRNVDTRLGAAGDRWVEFARQNIISTLIGMNIHTVYKHGFSAAVNSLAEVGVGNFSREFGALLHSDPQTGVSNWNFALQKSEELARRHQQWVDTLGGAHEEAIEGGGSVLSQARSKMIKWGAAPVAFFDLLSAVPTFLAEYKSQIRAGETEGTAVALANRAVRRAHGSTAITSRPEAMRGGPTGRLLTSLYGFFNQMLQRQYEIGWRSKEAIGAFKEGEYEEGKAHIPKIALLITSSIIAPAVIEHMVSGYQGEQKDGYTVQAAKAITGELSSSVPVVRDIVHALINNNDPSIGLLNTPWHELKSVYGDLKKPNFGMDRKHAGDLAKHFTTVFGMLTGLSNGAMSKFLKFAIDTKTGQQRPSGFVQTYRGVTTGQSREPKK